jgi:hypothetical protein
MQSRGSAPTRQDLGKVPEGHLALRRRTPKDARGEDLSRCLKRRAVECEPTADAYRCHRQLPSLSEVVLYDGGGCLARPRAAQAHAPENGLGVWKGR